jgi:hypothetical protein
MLLFHDFLLYSIDMIWVVQKNGDIFSQVDSNSLLIGAIQNFVLNYSSFTTFCFRVLSWLWLLMFYEAYTHHAEALVDPNCLEYKMVTYFGYPTCFGVSKISNHFLFQAICVNKSLSMMCIVHYHMCVNYICQKKSSYKSWLEFVRMSFISKNFFQAHIIVTYWL